MKKETEEKVFTNWTVKELIGKGSFGRVYRIEREEFGTVYQAAMKKIVIPQSDEDIEDAINEGMDEQSVTSYFQSFVEEIVNEFKLMSQLKGHTNIVSYEDHMVIPHEGRIGWDILIRMELLKSLKSVTAEQNMSETEVIKLGIDMCKALEICGKMNIIHRDIKPENIFVSSFGEYKLGDFGIARTAEKTMSNLSKKGTYTYMAPEVYKGEEYNATVDIYSLGLVMYRFMNYNRAPFLPLYPKPINFSDREASLTRRISEEPIPAPACGSKELKRIILKACAYRPAARYQTPMEMRSELEKLLQDLSGTNTAETPPVQMPVQDNAFADSEEDATVTVMETAAPEESDMTVADTIAQEDAEDETVSIFGTQTAQTPQKEEAAPPPVIPPAPQPPEPERPKKKKTGLFVGIGVAAVALIVIVVIAVSGIGGSHMASNDNLHEMAELNDRLNGSGSEADGIAISSNEYLYGHYFIDSISQLGWDSGNTFFEGMETFTVDEKNMAVIPAELYCFPEGSVYNTTLLGELLDEVGSDRVESYTSRTYIGNDTGEDIFEAIACMLFGDEVSPQVHNFYVENIMGQRDTVEMVFVDELKNRSARIGYYKVDGSTMEVSLLDVDESGKLILDPMSYDVAFSGKNLNIGKDGVTRTMEPYGVSGSSSDKVQIYGYVNSDADVYEGISYIYVSASDSDRQVVSVYFTDGWRADGVTAEMGADNTMTLRWEQQAKLGKSNEKREGAGSLTASYLDCGALGLVLHIDGKDYFYQKTETEYYARLVGDSVIDAELDEETLQEIGLTQMEMLQEIQEGFEAAGLTAGTDIVVDEKTGRITLNNGILFDVDSAELSGEGKDDLTKVFGVLEQVVFEDGYEDYLDEIIVEGHTDSTGDYEYNQTLSEERAAAVDDYCYEISPHISNYIETVGRSSDELVYDENGNEDRDASRRVVFRITLDADVFADGIEDDESTDKVQDERTKQAVDEKRMDLVNALKAELDAAGYMYNAVNYITVETGAGDQNLDEVANYNEIIIDEARGLLLLPADDFFDEGSDELTSEGLDGLTEIFNVLRYAIVDGDCSDYLDTVYVMGYSDDEILREARAWAVQEFAVGNGWTDFMEALMSSSDFSMHPMQVMSASSYDLLYRTSYKNADEFKTYENADTWRKVAFWFVMDEDACVAAMEAGE